MQILEKNQQNIQKMQNPKDLAQESAKNLTQDSKTERNTQSQRDSTQSVDLLAKAKAKRKHK